MRAANSAGVNRGQTLLARFAARAYHLGEHVVGQLHTLHSETIFNPQQPTGNQRIDQLTRHARFFECRLQREIVAEAGLGEQMILDERAHVGG